MSRDPRGGVGGSGEPYAYANHNPVNYVDPNGAWPHPLFQISGDEDEEGAGGGGGGGGLGPVGGGAGGAGAINAAEEADAAEAQLNAEQILEEKAIYGQTVATVKGRYPAVHSGWEGKSGFVQATNLARNLAGKIGFKFRSAGAMDQKIPGQFYASHAEPQLGAMMYYGKTAKVPIGVSNVMCPECQRFFNELALYTGEEWIVQDTTGLIRFPR